MEGVKIAIRKGKEYRQQYCDYVIVTHYDVIVVLAKKERISLAR